MRAWLAYTSLSAHTRSMKRFLRRRAENGGKRESSSILRPAFRNQQARHTGGKDDSQILPRFHFFAYLLLSRRGGDSLQSKGGSAPAEIARDARAGRDSAAMAEVASGARTARIDAQT